MLIAVYAIALNEEQFVKRFCDSAKDADLIIIGDTGSTDNTIALAKECGAVVPSIFISPWRFDKARDAVLSLIPTDIDICISLDLDEVLEEGWREEVKRFWTPETTRMRYKFDVGPNGIFYGEKIHARKGYFWKWPCHEWLQADPRITEHVVTTDKLLARHLPDTTKSRSQYLPLLEVATKEDPADHRSAFYYARELYFNKQWNEAIESFRRYLLIPSAIWHTERSYARRTIAKCLENIGQDPIPELIISTEETPEIRESWVDLAQAYYNINNWEDCYRCILISLEKSREYTHCEDSLSWAERPYDLASIAAWNMEMTYEAIKHCKRALEYNPTDPRLLNNLKLMTQ